MFIDWLATKEAIVFLVVEMVPPNILLNYAPLDRDFLIKKMRGQSINHFIFLYHG